MANIKITVKQPKLRIDMVARQNLDGSITLFDHPLIDIVLDAEKNKITAFAKERFGDEVYHTQQRLFDYLKKKGIVVPATVQAGNVFFSMKGEYPGETILDDKNVAAEQAILFAIYQWLKMENKYYDWEADYKEKEEERLTEPPLDETTPLGEVPQEPEKGSIVDSDLNRRLSSSGGYI